MSSVFFTSAQRIISQVFQWLQTSGQTRTSNILTDTFSAGIDSATQSGEGFLVVPGNNNTSSTPSINVTLGGIAYDPTGSRIFISSSDTTLYNASNVIATTNDGLGNFLSTPQSTGVVNIPVTQSSQNYIWINYLVTVDTTAFTLNKETDAKIFYKQTDGYNIQVTTLNIPPNSNSIYLANVNMLGGGAVALSNISQVGRSYYSVLPNIVPITTPLANASDRTPSYNPASTYTLEAHIKSVGTGTGISPFNPHNMSLLDLGISQFDTVPAHRQLEHGNAIIAGTTVNSYPSTSAMACSIQIVNPGSDSITVDQLLATEFAIVNGTAYNVNAIFGTVPTNASVLFPDTSGTYNVYWDSVTKSFAVTTASIAADVTKLWLSTVTYTFVGHGVSDHNALSALVERRRIGSTTDKYQRWTTTARPPLPLVGEYGFNLDAGSPEFFNGTAWNSFSVPSGTILSFAGISAPSGFLLCDGSAVSRTTFANLFSTIGTIWGNGDGSTTFNVPDSRGRTLFNVGAGSFSSVGQTGGVETHIHTQVAHSHTVNSHNHGIITDLGNHFHELPIFNNSGATQFGWTRPTNDPFGNISTLVGTVTTEPSGGSSQTYTAANAALSATTNLAHTHGGGTQNTSPGTDSQTPTINSSSDLNPYAVVTHIIKF